MATGVPVLYQERDTVMHRRDPRVKMLLFALLFVFLFIAPTWQWMLVRGSGDKTSVAPDTQCAAALLLDSVYGGQAGSNPDGCPGDARLFAATPAAGMGL